jgi:hypothetical protein
MQAVTPDAIPLLEDAPMQLLRKLSTLSSQPGRLGHWRGNYYADLNAYSLLNPDSLQIYFMDFNKVPHSLT